MALQQIQYVLPIQEGEHFIRALVPETSPAVRIDVVHHETDVTLCISGKIRTFRKEASDKLMIAFRRALLVRGVGITVEYTGPLFALFVVLDRPGIGKFASVIRQADRKKAGKTFVTK